MISQQGFSHFVLISSEAQLRELPVSGEQQLKTSLAIARGPRFRYSERISLADSA
ncbi:hypothetical protein H8B02_29990 [Bradyrhizobium sp. Pear77]|uniref:hypothetical protein n=1 Tax=Bradyrhizobium altum TaxID=1571202 RepID=UPI001E29675F|nr:hypothetical protein [Bradyrhizobium altum]MCC8957522.1 hypothetical protein [Bradyrhizobium altum]